MIQIAPLLIPLKLLRQRAVNKKATLGDSLVCSWFLRVGATGFEPAT